MCDSINSNCIVPLKIGSKARESQSLAAWEGTVYGFGYEDISLLTTFTLNLKMFLLQFIYLMFFNHQVQRIIDESYAGKKLRLLLPRHFFHCFSPGLSPTKSCQHVAPVSQSLGHHAALLQWAAPMAGEKMSPPLHKGDMRLIRDTRYHEVIQISKVTKIRLLMAEILCH